MFNKLKKIANVNGLYGVMEKTKEECNELIEAIEGNVEEEIIDETADVFVMLFQLMLILDIENKVYDRIDYKIDRTEKRLGI